MTDADLARWEAETAVGWKTLGPVEKAHMRALIAEVRRLRMLMAERCERKLVCQAECGPPVPQHDAPCALRAATNAATAKEPIQT